MNEQFYNLVALSNRDYLCEKDVLTLLEQATQLTAQQVKHIYSLTTHQDNQQYVLLSFYSLKLLFEALQTMNNSNNHEQVKIKKYKLPTFNQHKEEKSDQIISLLEECNSIIEFMNEVIETHLTINSYGRAIKQNLDYQHKLLATIAMVIV